MTSIKSRRVGGSGTKKPTKGWSYAEKSFGPFIVYLAAQHTVRKDSKGKAVKDENGKNIYDPTGELAMKVKIGNSYPSTVLGWNTEAAGPLATIAEHLDEFGEAVSAAVELWSDDTIIADAEKQLKSELSQPEKCRSNRPLSRAARAAAAVSE